MSMGASHNDCWALVRVRRYGPLARGGVMWAGVPRCETGKTATDVPSLRPYDFAIVDHKLVIVDPSNKVIADVLTK